LRITADRIGLEPCAASFNARAIHVRQALSGTITTPPPARCQHQCVSVHLGLLMDVDAEYG